MNVPCTVVSVHGSFFAKSLTVTILFAASTKVTGKLCATVPSSKVTVTALPSATWPSSGVSVSICNCRVSLLPAIRAVPAGIGSSVKPMAPAERVPSALGIGLGAGVGGSSGHGDGHSGHTWGQTCGQGGQAGQGLMREYVMISRISVASTKSSVKPHTMLRLRSERAVSCATSCGRGVGVVATVLVVVVAIFGYTK